MVDLPPLLSFHSHGIHESVENDLGKGNELTKDEPDVHHLDVGGGRETPSHTDEQRGEDQEGGEVNGDDSFEEKLLEKVGAVDDYHDEKGGDINCHDGIHHPSL